MTTATPVADQTGATAMRIALAKDIPFSEALDGLVTTIIQERPSLFVKLAAEFLQSQRK
jgi:hypothetical protein